MKYFYLQNLATPPREIEPQLPTWSPVDTAGFGLLPCIISPFSYRCFLGLPPTFSFPRRKVWERGCYTSVLLRRNLKVYSEEDKGGEGAEQGCGFRRSLSSARFHGVLQRAWLTPQCYRTLSYKGLTFATSPSPPPPPTIQLLAVYPDECKVKRYRQIPTTFTIPPRQLALTSLSQGWFLGKLNLEHY